MANVSMEEFEALLQESFEIDTPRSAQRDVGCDGVGQVRKLQGLDARELVGAVVTTR